MTESVVPFPDVLPPRRRRSVDLEFLPAALEVLDTPASPTARWTAGALAAFFTVGVAWSVFGQVDIIASAPGTVIPAGKSKIVQPLDPGIVQAILVKDGDHVTAGQPVIVLDATVATAERDRVARGLRQAQLEAAGLRALRWQIEGGAWQTAFEAPAGVPTAEVGIERAATTARSEEQAQKVASLVQQIAAKQAEGVENMAGIARLQASLPYLQKKRDMYRTLIHEGLGQMPAWADAEQVASDQAQQIAVMQRHAVQVDASKAGLVRDLAQARATYAHDVLKELAEAEQKTGELSAELAAASRKTEETMLAAPINGTVQQLAVHTIGGVVTAAEPLMTVVPDEGPVLIEATVENKDVGFVHVGQNVEVKVETFTFTRYGLLHGHVVDVSRDAAAAAPKPKQDDAEGGGTAGASERDKAATDAYVVHVVLDRDRLLVDGHEQAIAPGMSATAEIKTGRRSVISYLLSPLARRTSEAGVER